MARARLAVLATNGTAGYPHLVPSCYALDRSTVYTAIDDKPKSSVRLQRLDNIAADSRVTVLVDHYDDLTWDRLWWIKVTGTASVVSDGWQHEHGTLLLLAKYRQYAEHRLDGPIIVVSLLRWRSWASR